MNSTTRNPEQRMPLRLLAAMVVVLATLLSACGSDGDQSSDERRTAASSNGGESGEGSDPVFSGGGNEGTPDGFETIEGATDIGAYSVQMLGPASSEVSENSFWPIIDTIYTARSGGREMRFVVSDRLEHWVEDEGASNQAAAAQFEVFEFAFATEYTAERDITFTPQGYDEELIGHEIDFGRDGRHRTILRDKVLYSMSADGLTDAEWDYFVNSLQIHPMIDSDA